MALRVTEEEFEALRRRIGVQRARDILRDYGAGDAKVVTPETKPKRSKYGNRRVEVSGMKFDSQHEADVYLRLMADVKSGLYKCVMRQVRFDLGGGPNAGEKTRYQYVADFVTIDREDRAAVWDAKSEITRKNRTYINKKKQMLAEWGLEIREV